MNSRQPFTLCYLAASLAPVLCALPMAAAMAASPPAAPLELAVERDEAAARVRWIDPALTGIEAVSGHELEIAAGPDYGTWAPAQLAGPVACQGGNPSRCEARVTGLSNGTRYKLRVRALNPAGAGHWADLKSWVTPVVLSELPGIPGNLAGSISEGRLTGTWTPATTAGQGARAVTRYRLVALADGRLAGHCDTDGDPPATHCSIGGLVSGVPYVLKVRAFNDRQQFSDFSPPAGPYKLE